LSDTADKPVDTGTEFREFLAEIGETQTSFARVPKRTGDDRQKATIVRHI
jgi:hypothetical protein